MHRVAARAWIIFALALVLILGLVFFTGEYAANKTDWGLFPANPHIFNAGNLGCGVVADRDGEILLDTRDSWQYAEDPRTRMSTLHWLGDQYGYISAPALSKYVPELSGYDWFNGLYNYGSNCGSMQLTISAKVQIAALEAMGDRKGTIAVYNYKTGEILCAVTTPTYDPLNKPDVEGDTTGAYTGVYLNRFTQSTYTPGSIFKLVTTAAALETVPDILEMKFTCSGVVSYGIDKVTCPRSHGRLDLKGALARSCNCAFAQIARLVGRDTMTEYVQKYGVTRSVSFDGVTTKAGNYDVTNAASVELAWSAIGQHTNQISPCAFMAFMGIIAGGGEAANPYLVSSALCDNLGYRAEASKYPLKMEAATAKTLADYMENNTNIMYGQENFSGLTVCAKSGTAEVGETVENNALFAGFVRDEEYPLAFIVIAEHSGSGSKVCVPILSNVLAACVEAMDKK